MAFQLFILCSTASCRCGLALPHGLSMSRPQAFVVLVGIGMQFPLPILFSVVFLQQPFHVADVLAESCLFEFWFES